MVNTGFSPSSLAPLETNSLTQSSLVAYLALDSFHHFVVLHLSFYYKILLLALYFSTVVLEPPSVSSSNVGCSIQRHCNLNQV